jgi:hypothetical protein
MGIDGGLYGGVASAAGRRHATKTLTTICLPVRKTAVHLEQAPLQAALAHRGFVQQVEGLQAHRNPRYDRLARNYLASVCLAAALVGGFNESGP